jgi:2-polyprenyl-3-methyl-5-hydroxy-6-metoxy-1,4-benzoquinol methylase
VGTRPGKAQDFGGDEQAWRQARLHITEGIIAEGTFLDVGCANGLLLESVAAWCAERGPAVEPYGVDISARLVELARRSRADDNPRRPYRADAQNCDDR